MRHVLKQLSPLVWELPQAGTMCTRAVFSGSEASARSLTDGVLIPLAQVAGTPHALGLAIKTARLRPLACIKGYCRHA